VHDGVVTFSVSGAAAFVPRLFAELGVGIRAVTMARPSLEDVFLACTGRIISDSEQAEGGNVAFTRAMARRR
jgi:ABC-2 type transport system ATP-binding protein